MAPEQGPSKTASQASEYTSTDMTTRSTKKPVPSPESKQTLAAEAPSQTQPPHRSSYPSRSSSPRLARRVRTSWIASLNKRELGAYLRESGIDDQGVVEELRRRLSTYINGGNYDQAQFQRFAELEQRHNPATSSSPRDTTDQNVDEPAQPIATRIPTLRDAQRQEGAFEIRSHTESILVDDRTFDRMRSWAIRFNEDDNPIDFVDRIEELASAQRIVLDQVPFTLSEVLGGEALAWWRNRRAEWTGWQDFRNAFLKHFLPNKFFSKLEDTVRQRTQQRGESFRQYAVALESLMRHLQPTRNEKLDRIYDNSLPSTRLHIKRTEFRTLDELTELVSHLEATQVEVEANQSLQTLPERQPSRNVPQRMTTRAPLRPPRDHQNPFRQPSAAIPAPARLAIQAPPEEIRYISNPQSVCRQCAEPGHQQRDCHRERVLFCWHCGRIGLRSIHYCPNAPPPTTLRHMRVRKHGSPNQHDHAKALRLQDITADGESITVTICSGSETWRGIIDTGSCHSFISSSVAQSMQPQVGVHYPTRMRVIMAGGQQQDVQSGFKAELHAHGKTYPVRFLTLPLANDAFISGMDILRLIGTSIRVGNTSINLQSGTCQHQPENHVHTYRMTTKPVSNLTHKTRILRQPQTFVQRSKATHPGTPLSRPNSEREATGFTVEEAPTRGSSIPNRNSTIKSRGRPKSKIARRPPHRRTGSQKPSSSKRSNCIETTRSKPKGDAVTQPPNNRATSGCPPNARQKTGPLRRQETPQTFQSDNPTTWPPGLRAATEAAEARDRLKRWRFLHEDNQHQYRVTRINRQWVARRLVANPAQLGGQAYAHHYCTSRGGVGGNPSPARGSNLCTTQDQQASTRGHRPNSLLR